MAQATTKQHSPQSIHQVLSPKISVTSCEEDESSSDAGGRVGVNNGGGLVPQNSGRLNYSDSERSEKYFTASSGEDYFDDDDDDVMCINLDLDDTTSLSGLHIDLKTLQAVSSMLAHYNPIIQSDKYGNPIFVAPPPPSEVQFSEEEAKNALIGEGCRMSKQSDTLTKQSVNADADTNFYTALQDFDDVVLTQDTNLFSDAMAELTDVMEKMTMFVNHDN